jgi:DNA modification methylase
VRDRRCLRVSFACNGQPAADVVRTVLEGSKKRGPVLDPFAGAGTVGRVVASLGREWVGVARDPRTALVTARRLRVRRVRASLPDCLRAPSNVDYGLAGARPR